MRRALSMALMLSLWLAGASRDASAVTFTFSGVPAGAFVGPLVEGDLTATLLSGGFFGELTLGDPAPHLEGSVTDGGGTLGIARNDLIGGLFTFDQASVAQFNFGATNVVFEGYLGGFLQASDSFLTSSTNLVHTAPASSNLAGVPIDELRVTLDASNAPFQWEAVDSLVFTFLVPEPTPAVLLAFGLLALAARRRLASRFPA